MTPEQFINKWFRGNYALRKKMEKDFKRLMIQPGNWHLLEHGFKVVKAKVVSVEENHVVMRFKFDSLFYENYIVSMENIGQKCDPPKDYSNIIILTLIIIILCLLLKI